MRWGDVLSLLGILLVLLLVLAASYLVTRWAGQNLGGGFLAAGRGGRLQVLDRAAVGRDQSVLVVKAGQRYLLLGSTPAGLTLLAELTREEGENRKPSGPQAGAEGKRFTDFRALLGRLREKDND